MMFLAKLEPSIEFVVIVVQKSQVQPFFSYLPGTFPPRLCPAFCQSEPQPVERVTTGANQQTARTITTTTNSSTVDTRAQNGQLFILR